jgi:tetratricopeptide (TPR) repeat protein
MKTGIKSIIGVAAIAAGVCYGGQVLYSPSPASIDSAESLQWQSLTLDDPQWSTAETPARQIVIGKMAELNIGAVGDKQPPTTAMLKTEAHGAAKSQELLAPYYSTDAPAATRQLPSDKEAPNNTAANKPANKPASRPTADSGTAPGKPESNTLVNGTPAKRFVTNPYATEKPALATRNLPPVGNTNATTNPHFGNSPTEKAVATNKPAAPAKQHLEVPVRQIRSMPAAIAVTTNDSQFVPMAIGNNKTDKPLAVADSSQFQPVPPASRPATKDPAAMPEQAVAESTRPGSVGNRAPQPPARPMVVASPIVEKRAGEHLNYGMSLARRGATFAAREEFVEALRLIADSRDMQFQSRESTESLADGLRALNEADDFVMASAEQQLNMDLAPIVAMHESKVFTTAEANKLSSIQALQAYYQYANHKISHGVGNSLVAAETLHAMGKLLMSQARHDAAGKPIDQAKAIVMFQAALSANPDDYRSANELGVLMARSEKWNEARELFTRSLLSQQSAEAWMNLSRTHQQLGQTDLAQRAANEYQLLVDGGSAGDMTNVMEWVSADQFESNSATPELINDVRKTRTAQSVPEESESSGTRKGVFGNVKKWF